MLRFHLSVHSRVPAYVQVVQQVRQALLSWALRPGEQLPTVKAVVMELAINPNTVLKAYRELARLVSEKREELERELKKSPDFQLYLMTTSSKDRARMERLLLEVPIFRLWHRLTMSIRQETTQ
jgi:DNA-binding transcriptional MocR family regulator